MVFIQLNVAQIVEFYNYFILQNLPRKYLPDNISVEFF